MQSVVALQDISNVSPWSQITAQFNLFNSGSGSSPSPAAATSGRRLLQKQTVSQSAPHHPAQAAAAMQAADALHDSSVGRSLLQAVNSSYADFESADTTTSDLTKEGQLLDCTCICMRHEQTSIHQTCYTPACIRRVLHSWSYVVLCHTASLCHIQRVSFVTYSMCHTHHYQTLLRVSHA